jgi:hypothetical protein
VHRCGRLVRKVRIRLKVAVIALAMPAFASCAVREATPDGITIVHNALHPEIAEYEAQQHCAQYGKRAVLSKQLPLRRYWTRCSRDRTAVSSSAWKYLDASRPSLIAALVPHWPCSLRRRPMNMFSRATAPVPISLRLFVIEGRFP